MTNDLKLEFVALSGRLSPENLCADGELSRTAVRYRYAEIRREWKALEKKAGRKVSEEEGEDWSIDEALRRPLR